MDSLKKAELKKVEVKPRCTAVLTTGKNKGKRCSKNCKNNTNYCSIHLKKYGDINSNNNNIEVNE
jgi:hypothetical protein